MPSTAVTETGTASQPQQKGKGKEKEKGTPRVVGSQNGKLEKKAALAQLPWTPIVQGRVSRLPMVFTRDAE